MTATLTTIWTVANMSVGDLRKAAGITQAQLAELLGVIKR